MKISVIIPVYNVQEYLRECIESVLLQRYNNLEIILVNDGSTDLSGEICEEYKNKYTNIKVIHKKNGGLSDARNIGIRKATGEYLIFLDSDDYWENRFLENLVKEINFKKNYDLIFFRFNYFYHDSNTKQEELLNLEQCDIMNQNGLDVLRQILHKNNFKWYACRFIVSRKYILENNLFFIKGRNYEDALWTPEIFLNAQNVYYYNYPVYNYRLNREGQITANISKKNLIDSIFVSKYWMEKLQLERIDDTLKYMILKNINTRYFYAIWFCNQLNNNEQKEVIEELQKNKVSLNYCNGINERMTNILVNLLGFPLCCRLYEYGVIMKRKIRR